MHADLTTWATRLRAVASAGLAGTPLARLLGPTPVTPAEAAALTGGFRDSVGHRRAVDPALLAWLVGVPPVGTPASPSFAEACWWSLHGGPLPCVRTAGPLIPGDGVGPTADPWAGRASVELWTESELCALHALWNHALLAGRACDRGRADALLARVRLAVDWLVCELQPDNATGHPWAVHAFAWVGVTHTDSGRGAEADLYAQALLNTAIVAGAGASAPGGTPDVFSACILLDAARGIERWQLQQPEPTGSEQRSGGTQVPGG